MDSGNYTIIVYNNGDENHKPSNATGKFIVLKRTPEIIIEEIPDTVYNNSVTIKFNASNTTGNYTLTLYKNNTTIANITVNETEYEFNNLTTGEYNLTIKSKSDKNHNEKTETNISYGEELNLTVNLINGTDGKYQLIKNNTLINEGNLTNLTLANLDAGNYTIIVYNDGDENHNPSNSTENFTVLKQTPLIKIEEIPDTVYNNSVTIKFNASNTTGNYTLTLHKNNTLIANININKTEYEFNNLNAGEYNLTVKSKSDKNHNEKTESILFNITPANSEIHITNITNITYGDELNLKAEVINGTDGKYQLIKNNTIIKEGNLDNLTFNNLNAGNYTIIVYNKGDENHNPSSSTENFTVLKQNSKITIEKIPDSIYNKSVKIKYTITNIKDHINVKVFKISELILNKTFNVNESIILNNLSAGSYIINIEYAGDENHLKTNSTERFNITKTSSKITVKNMTNITYGEELNLKSELINGTNGKYELNKDNTIINEGNLDNLTFKNLDAGNYTLTVYNDGDENHKSSYESLNFTVFKKHATLEINPVKELNFNDDVNITYHLTDNAEGFINIQLFKNNELILNDTLNQTGTINLFKLSSGEYKVNITYLESNNYLKISNITNFKVNKVYTILINLTIKNYQLSNASLWGAYTLKCENKTICLNIEKINETVIITLNNNTYINKTNLKIYSYELKDYIHIKVMSDSVCGEEYLDVLKIAPEINVSYDNGRILIKTHDDFKGCVLLIINNQTFNINVTGSGIADVSKFENKEYDYVLSYEGDDEFLPFIINSTITVKNIQKTKIIFKNTESYWGKISYITATLQDIKTQALSSMKVTVSIDGKTYTTNKKGQIKIPVTHLKPATYKITLTFKGNSEYEKTAKTSKLTILKVKPTLKCSKKTFKSSVKNKKYRVKLNIKNAKITLKIKGKKYTAKTNNKGKAIFKLKLKKKGTYTGKIYFNGNAYYEKINEKVKIKIK